MKRMICGISVVAGMVAVMIMLGAALPAGHSQRAPVPGISRNTAARNCREADDC